MMRTFFQRFPRLLTVVAVSLFALVLGATAGSLTPSALPAATMYSLSNLYDAIASATFDSSAIVANQNGSLLGNLKYIENQIAWASSSGDIWNLNSGNVGIGTSSPGGKLTIVQPSVTAHSILVDRSTDNATASGSFFKFRNSAGTQTVAMMDVKGGFTSNIASISPTIVGSVTHATQLSGANNVFVSGRYAYVGAANSDRLTIIDISNPASSSIVGSVSDAVSLDTPVSIYVAGRYAYVAASGADRFTVVDVANPSNPIIAATLTSTQLDGIQGVAVAGRYAYVTASNVDRVTIIDISNPSSPVIVGTVTDSVALDGVYGIAVQGHYAYVAAGNSDSVTVLDISNPSDPTIVGTVTSGTQLDLPVGIVVSGRYAYVAVAISDAVTIIDIKNPTSPGIVGSVTDARLDGLDWIVVSGRYAYVPAYNAKALTIVDVSNTSSPAVVGSVTDITKLGGAIGIAVSGRYAYVTGRTVNYFNAIDITGFDIPNLVTGDIQTTSIEAWGDADVGGNMSIRGGLNVGAFGVKSDGPLSVLIASTSSDTVASASRGSIFGLLHEKGYFAGDGIFMNLGASTTADRVTGNFAKFSLSGTPRFLVESSGAVLASGAAQFGAGGAPSSASYSRFGTSSTTHSGSITSANDLLVSGDLEVDASAAFDGAYVIIPSGKLGVQTGANAVTVALQVGNDGAFADWIRYGGDTSFGTASNTSYLRTGLSFKVQTSAGTGTFFSTAGNGVGNTLSGTTIALDGNVNAASLTPLTVSGVATSGNIMRWLSTSGDVHSVVDNSGNFGIGATTPEQKLTIGGNILASSSGNVSLTLRSTSASGTDGQFTILTASTSDRLDIRGGAGTFGETLMSIASSGFVGIGTTTPTTKLDIIGNASVSARLEIVGRASASQVYIGPSSASSQFGAVQLNVSGVLPTSFAGRVATTAGKNPLYVHVRGRYAYVTNNTGASNFQIFDIANPASPMLLSTTTTGGYSQGMISGKYFYISNLGDGTFQIFDVSNPVAPANVGNLTISRPNQIYIQGRYAYVTSDSPQKLYVIDIANPSAPKLVASIATGGSAYGIAVQGEYAFVSTLAPANTLKVYNIANPASPVLVSAASTSANPYWLTVEGKYAYLSASTRFDIFDISNPSTPASVSSTAVTTYGTTAVQGRYVYIPDYAANSVRVYDISNPAIPTSVGSFSAGTGTYAVAVQGRFAYVTSITDKYLNVYNLGGAYLQQLEAGGIEASTLSLRNNLQVFNDAEIRGGLSIGSGLHVQGPFAISSSASGYNTFRFNPEGGASLSSGFEIGGYASVSSNLYLSSALQAGWTTGSATTYSRFGTDTTFNTNWISAPSDLMLSSDLEVHGSAQFSSFLRVSSGSTNALFANAGTGMVGVGTINLGTNALEISGTASISGNMYFGGNVGIGTTSPTAKIHIGPYQPLSGVVDLMKFFPNDGAVGWKITQSGHNLRFGGTNSDMGSTMTLAYSPANPQGAVGIGTTSPAAVLDVTASSSHSSGSLFRVASASGAILTVDRLGTTTFDISTADSNQSKTKRYLSFLGCGGCAGWGFSRSGNNFNVSSQDGRVMTFEYMAGGAEIGIGTTTPQALFDVTASAGYYTAGDLFRVASGSPDATHFMVKKSGNVGIGTTTPTTKLDIIGNASVSAILEVGGNTLLRSSASISAHLELVGNASIGGNVTIAGNCSDAPGGGGCTADYAEVYARDPADSMSAGDLLSLNPVTGKVTKASTASTNLVGVFTSAPGTLIGQRSNSIQLGIGTNVMSTLDPDEIPVALIGRVPVRVSLENGPISIGDRLSVSSTPGIAAKAVSAGMTAGIAMEALSELSSGSSAEMLMYVNTSYWAPSVEALVPAESDVSSEDGVIATLVQRILAYIADVFGVTIESNRVRTPELCVDDVCVTREEFRRMLEVTGVRAIVSTPELTSSPTPTPVPEDVPVSSGSSTLVDSVLVEETPLPSEAPTPTLSESPTPEPTPADMGEEIPAP